MKKTSSRLARASGVLLAAGVLLVACNKKPTEANPAQTSAAVEKTDAAAKADAAGKPDAKANTAAKPSSDASPKAAGARIACEGKTSCAVGSEVCCRGGGCAPVAPGDEVSFREQQSVCAKHYPEHSYSFARCDDSSDCSDDATCCHQVHHDGEMNPFQECVPLESDGTPACLDAEACAAGQPCRSKGTHCVEGRCELKDKPAPVCDGTECSEKVKCSSPAQCAPGQKCWINWSPAMRGAYTYCAGSNIEPHGTQTACHSVSDCPPEYGVGKKAKGCEPHDELSIKACSYAD